LFAKGLIDPQDFERTVPGIFETNGQWIFRFVEQNDLEKHVTVVRHRGKLDGHTFTGFPDNSGGHFDRQVRTGPDLSEGNLATCTLTLRKSTEHKHPAKAQVFDPAATITPLLKIKRDVARKIDAGIPPFGDFAHQLSPIGSYVCNLFCKFAIKLSLRCSSERWNPGRIMDSGRAPLARNDVLNAAWNERN